MGKLYHPLVKMSSFLKRANGYNTVQGIAFEKKAAQGFPGCRKALGKIVWGKINGMGDRGHPLLWNAY